MTDLNRQVCRSIVISFTVTSAMVLYVLTGWGFDAEEAIIPSVVLGFIVSLAAAHGTAFRIEREQRQADRDNRQP